MTRPPLTTADYPLAERRPDLIRTPTGKPLNAITLDAIERGDIAIADLSITADALVMQAEIAEAAGRPTLGQNLRRAAELVAVPQDVVIRVYELLRPGRAKAKEEILTAARALRDDHGAMLMAAFIEEAAAVYERRGLFRLRY
ncbi:MAG: glycerol dehydratase [Alphaproteobacteria bacterium]|nr:glycerol dehydratase [Alphaproteobacteria bacterium]